MKRIISLALVLTTLGTLQAQTVKGTVSNAKDGTPLPFTNVTLMRASDTTFLRGTTTDSKGAFSLDADTVETLLRISAIGFETVMIPVAEGPLDIKMNEGTTTLDAVEITASKPMYAADGEKKIYNVSEDPTIQNGTAQDALQNTPGVQVDGDGNITLNGKSVTVYINDRESHYTDDMLKQYIKTLTADQISSIEAIEYPPAKYGGGGPVVNIRTSQKVMRNSYFSFGGSGSSRPDFSPFLSYAYANEKLRFNAYMRYSWDNWDSQSDGDGTMYDQNLDTVRSYSRRSSSSSRSHNLSTNINLGYDFDTMNSLSLYASFSPSWSRSDGDGRIERTDLIGTAMEDFSFSSHSDSRSNYLWGYYGASFEHKFNNEGHQISLDLSGYFGGGGSSGTSWEHYDAQPAMSYDEREESSYRYGNFDFGINYSLPYSDNGEISAGLSYSHGFSPDETLRDTLGTDGLFHTDYLRSDSTESPSDDLSLYLSWRRKWGNFTIRLGSNLSYEHGSNRHLGSPEYDTTVNNFSFRPSILLMYNTESMHSFSFNYSTSVSHPSAGNLDRYVSYGTDSYSTGNPALEPSYSHDFGLSYDKSFEQGHSLGISANYSLEYNRISHLSWPVYSSFFGRYVPFSQPMNGGDSRDGNIYVYARWRHSALFSMTLSGGIGDDWYRTLIRPDEWFEDEMASWNIRLNARAKLFNLVWVSASAHYSSRSHGWSALQVSEPRFGMDVSASADLFDRKLSFYLNINDIFNTANWNSSSINPYSPSTSNYTYNSQSISFGITLRFGRMDLGNSSNEGIQASSGGNGGGK
ncbi:MAG: TonB-dependent receptor [Bacteroidales bacterium]|nr:TonB-dependent receptor [Bacteroidales bacterium]